MKSVARNIPKLQALSWTWGFILLTGIMVPFLKDRGLNLAEIYFVQATFAITMSICEIPTGYFSDMIGRKGTLVWAGIFKGIGGTILAAGHGFASVLIAYILLGIANSLLSGTDISLLYESLPASENRKREQAIATSYMFGYLSLATATILGGRLALSSLSIAAWVNALTAWFSLFIAMFLVEPETHRTRLRKTWSHFKQEVLEVGHQLFRKRTPARLFVYFTVFYSFATAISMYTFQTRWVSLGVALSTMSILTASLSLTGAMGGKFLPSITKRLSKRMTILILSLLPILAFLGALSSNLIVVFFSALLIECVRALLGITFIDRINSEVGNELRATTNSIISFASRIFIAAVAPLWGYAAERYSLELALPVLASVYGAVFIYFAVVYGKEVLNQKDSDNASYPAA